MYIFIIVLQLLFIRMLQRLQFMNQNIEIKNKKFVCKLDYIHFDGNAYFKQNRLLWSREGSNDDTTQKYIEGK